MERRCTPSCTTSTTSVMLFGLSPIKSIKVIVFNWSILVTLRYALSLLWSFVRVCNMARGDNHGVNFVFEFYDQDSTFPPFLENVLETGWLYAYILHDKDKLEDGSPAKPHYHAIVHTDNDRSLSSVAEKLHVAERFTQVLKKGDDASDCKTYLVYMLHWDQKSVRAGKHRYQLDELYGSLKDKYIKYLENYGKTKKHENDEDIIVILDYVSNCSGYCSMDSLIRFAVSKGLYGLLRRSGYLIRSVLSEHNEPITSKLQRATFEQRNSPISVDVALLRDSQAKTTRNS